MRLLGAPAIPAPGLHPFLGIGTAGFGGRCRSLQQNAEQAAPFGHDPKADAGFRKDRAPAKPYCALPNFFAHGSRRRFAANWKAAAASRRLEAAASQRAGGLMCDVKE
jgi:hypothetical protein